MGEEEVELPKVVVVGSPTCFPILEPLYSHKFHFLNPNPSHLSLQHFLHHHNPSSILALLCSANYALTADVLRLLPDLRLILTTSAGTDHIDLRECRRRGIQVAGAGKLFSEDVADVAIALLIDVTRKISATDRCLRTQNRSNSSWEFFPFGSKDPLLHYRESSKIGCGRVMGVIRSGDGQDRDQSCKTRPIQLNQDVG